MIKNIKIQQLIENYESANNPANISFKKYVERESQNDPNFFRFLFEEEIEDDFDFSLTDEQREQFEEFLEKEVLTL